MTVTEKIAEIHGIAKEEVEKEITTAISIAMSSEDEEAQMLWQKFAPDGKVPTIENLIEQVIFLIKDKL